MPGTYFVVILFILGMFIFIKKGVIKLHTAIEGIIIGVVSGFVISYATDVNFQATMHYPWVKIGQIVNKQIRYISKNWANIKVTQFDEKTDSVSFEATNIASGLTVTISNKPLFSLPADLRYDIVTGDSLTLVNDLNQEK